MIRKFSLWWCKWMHMTTYWKDYSKGMEFGRCLDCGNIWETKLEESSSD